MDALPFNAPLQNGAFVVERVLARSGFGLTYRARDETLQRSVALKEFFPSGCRRDPFTSEVQPAGLLSVADFEDGRARFLEEARALALFHHPNIVAVHGFFQENHTAYLAMEFLEGQTLHEHLQSRGALGEREMLRLASQLCDALATVHHAHRLHRDLKPDNVVLCNDNRVVIVDFGLSTRFVGDDAYGTRQLDNAQRFGTPGYAPLEQYTQSGRVSQTSDIYALGATLYHALTGHAPPPATDRAFGSPLEPIRHFQSVSTPVKEAIEWALEMKPEARPPSVRAFADRFFARDQSAQVKSQLLGVLTARSVQLQQREAAHRLITSQVPNLPTRTMTGAVLTAPESAPPSTQPLPQADDSGCFQFAFAAYLVLWLLAGLICVGGFLARIVIFGW